MNSSTLRRLAADHAALYRSELPPYYLFPAGAASMPEDLTQLTILLTGPQGTPYVAGVWKLHLKIPLEYPKTPPKASFRTKIWHPNVEESTGSVCVDTLKRDWSSKLTLRDILVTISCLLIHPNPDSALNSAAGHLLQEDYSAFAAQARLMTSIHAAIPHALRDTVAAAQRRGEDSSRPATLKLTTRKRPYLALEPTPPPTAHEDSNGESEWDDDENASKENDPHISPTPVIMPNLPQRPRLPKRPLSDLPTPIESPTDDDDDIYGGMTQSERNVAANTPLQSSRFDFATQTPNLSANVACLSFTSSEQERERERPIAKLPERSRASGSFNFANWMKEQDINSSCSSPKGLMIMPFDDRFNFEGRVDFVEDAEMQEPRKKRVCSHEMAAQEEKENITEVKPLIKTVKVEANVGRKMATANVSVAGSGKVKPRIGLRRL